MPQIRPLLQLRGFGRCWRQNVKSVLLLPREDDPAFSERVVRSERVCGELYAVLLKVGIVQRMKLSPAVFDARKSNWMPIAQITDDWRTE